MAVKEEGGDEEEVDRRRSSEMKRVSWGQGRQKMKEVRQG